MIRNPISYFHSVISMYRKPVLKTPLSSCKQLLSVHETHLHYGAKFPTAQNGNVISKIKNTLQHNKLIDFETRRKAVKFYSVSGKDDYSTANDTTSLGPASLVTDTARYIAKGSISDNPTATNKYLAAANVIPTPPYNTAANEPQTIQQQPQPTTATTPTQQPQTTATMPTQQYQAAESATPHQQYTTTVNAPPAQQQQTTATMPPQQEQTTTTMPTQQHPAGANTMPNPPLQATEGLMSYQQYQTTANDQTLANTVPNLLQQAPMSNMPFNLDNPYQTPQASFEPPQAYSFSMQYQQPQIAENSMPLQQLQTLAYSVPYQQPQSIENVAPPMPPVPYQQLQALTYALPHPLLQQQPQQPTETATPYQLQETPVVFIPNQQQQSVATYNQPPTGLTFAHLTLDSYTSQNNLFPGQINRPNMFK